MLLQGDKQAYDKVSAVDPAAHAPPPPPPARGKVSRDDDSPAAPHEIVYCVSKATQHVTRSVCVRVRGAHAEMSLSNTSHGTARHCVAVNTQQALIMRNRIMKMLNHC